MLPQAVREEIASRVAGALRFRRSGTRDRVIRVAGCSIPLRITINPGSRNIVFAFHGAVHQESRKGTTFAHFPNRQTANSHQISIADPSLVMHRNLSLAWFCGHEGVDVQGIVSAICIEAARLLGAERRIYTGGSGGGFAALYFSHRDPGSVVVAFNPQTRIMDYSGRLVANYRKACWPSLAKDADLAKVTCVDLVPLYQKGLTNTVIYVQSNGDRRHFTRQMMPMVGAIARASDRQNFILHSDYWGELGHVSPPEEGIAWLAAACTAPTMQVEDLIQAWHETAHGAASPPSAETALPAAAPQPEPVPLKSAPQTRQQTAQQGAAGGHPYRGRPESSFWKPAVSERHIADLDSLSQPIAFDPDDRIATAGSCFAQHIGHHLAQRGCNYMDLEPAPPAIGSTDEARARGYDLFSCRYGNIYTSRQLLQLLLAAQGRHTPAEAVWMRDGRYFDALRPSVEPTGMASAQEVLAARERHLEHVLTMFKTLDVLVFTLGLTEGWESRLDGTMYPTAPGTIAGQYDPSRHALRNLRYGEVMADMETFWQELRLLNPGARLLLTVSPVPLAATASDEHVLPATVYSKSVLRAVAGDLAEDHEDIHYFPSYEIIASHPAKGMFFEPDQRQVNPLGVELVMKTFFTATGMADLSGGAPASTGIVCEEGKLADLL